MRRMVIIKYAALVVLTMISVPSVIIATKIIPSRVVTKTKFRLSDIMPVIN